MKYVSDVGNTLKDTPVSSSLGLAGAAAATVAVMRHAKLESPVLQGAALLAAVAGFAGAYAASRGLGYGLSQARNSTLFGKSGCDSTAAKDDVELKDMASPAPGKTS